MRIALLAVVAVILGCGGDAAAPEHCTRKDMNFPPEPCPASTATKTGARSWMASVHYVSTTSVPYTDAGYVCTPVHVTECRTSICYLDGAPTTWTEADAIRTCLEGSKPNVITQKARPSLRKK